MVFDRPDLLKPGIPHRLLRCGKKLDPIAMRWDLISAERKPVSYKLDLIQECGPIDRAVVLDGLLFGGESLVATGLLGSLKASGDDVGDGELNDLNLGVQVQFLHAFHLVLMYVAKQPCALAVNAMEMGRFPFYGYFRIL